MAPSSPSSPTRHVFMNLETRKRHRNRPRKLKTCIFNESDVSTASQISFISHDVPLNSLQLYVYWGILLHTSQRCHHGTYYLSATAEAGQVVHTACAFREAPLCHDEVMPGSLLGRIRWRLPY
mmetsp:Transcript_43133/g.71532  ORF Transcript_43133/g.71532 Transcript_43133/m.71532 type:complete len:123 (+) Transcript_43133:1550-1918(+)